jgi:cytochrome b pre-mRNA-processing protein 3
MILARFRRSPHARSIASLYGAIVAQARSPGFYTGYGVADTVEGRFDLIVLHLVLVTRRLDRSSQTARGLGQGLFDAFCRDLDANLREMGVGDFAVPKRMQRFAEAFYGRQAAYGAALAADDERDFENALARNIFPGQANSAAARLARYGREAVRALGSQADHALIAGDVAFPNPEAIADA